MKNVYIGAAVLLFVISAVLGGYLLFFINQTVFLPIESCRPVFIFTPESAQRCSEIHWADAVILQFSSPLIYFFLLTSTLLTIVVVKLLWGKLKKA